MARDFVAASSDIITISTHGSINNLATNNFAVFTWANVDTTTSTPRFFTTGDAGGDRFLLFTDTDENLRHNYSPATPAATESSTTYSLDTWIALLFRYDNLDSNTPEIYLDGTEVSYSAQGSGSWTGDDSGQNKYMGNASTLNRDYDGQLSNMTIWTNYLTAVEITALSRGVNPFAIRNSNLVGFWSLNGNESPEPEWINQQNGVLTGTSKGATNPPVELIENYL